MTGTGHHVQCESNRSSRPFENKHELIQPFIRQVKLTPIICIYLVFPKTLAAAKAGLKWGITPKVKINKKDKASGPDHLVYLIHAEE